MTSISSNGLQVIIIGGGVSGLTAALALTRFCAGSHIPRIHVFEIRPEPATIGGAVNLTPNALRMLDYLGALKFIRERGYGKDIDYLEIFDSCSGKIAETDFRGLDGNGIGDPPYKALRITRGDTLKAILAAVQQHENIKIICGKRTVKIEETPESVTLHFEDGGTATGDLLLGCDGIHSVTRLAHVEPARKATYTGVSNAFGFAPVRKDFEPHFACTAINFAPKGMLLTSYHSSAADSIYVGALMQIEDVGSREGWRSVGADAEETGQKLLDRFGDSNIACIKPLIEQTKDFFLWPVFTLSKNGKWATERVMLLGDAAHAMPPQGESTGIVLEDTVIFARCLQRWIEKGSPSTMKEAFDAYETLRRKRIDDAFEESKNVVRTVSDAGWFGHKVKMMIVPWYLWYSRPAREAHFLEDVASSNIGY